MSCDGVAILPLEVVAECELVSVALAAFGDAPLSVNGCGNILELCYCFILHNVLTGDDLAVLIELEVVGEEGGCNVAHDLSIIGVLVGELIPVGRRKSGIRVVRICLRCVVSFAVVGVVGVIRSVRTTLVRSCLLCLITASNNRHQHYCCEKYCKNTSEDCFGVHSINLSFQRS